MKYLRLAFLCLVCCAISAAQTALAQTNVLRVDTVKAPSGKLVSLNVVLENQSDVTGVQFDICVPYDLATDSDDVVVAEAARSRIPNHKVGVRFKDNPWKNYFPNGEGTGASGMYYKRYRVIIYSERNELVVDDHGTLLTLQLTTDVALQNNVLLPVYVENVTLTDPQKQNIATTAKNGAIVIEQIPRPDLEPSDVTFTPSTVNPGDSVTVSWKVSNVGLKPTEDGWTEQISLVNLAGTTAKVIGTAYYENVLANGSSVNRQVKVGLPQNVGMDGLCKIKVEVVPTDKTGEHPTMRDNNTVISSTNINIEKKLTFELSKIRFAEGQNYRVMAKLSRSGSWTQSQTFHINLTPQDSRLDIPEAVSIPAGQSGVVFYFNVLDNTKVDADSVVTITVSHAEYTSVSQRIVIEDNEYPDFTVEASKSVLTEGEEFTLTITTPTPVTEATTFKIVSEDNKRFLFNTNVVMPAGASTVTATIRTLDDDVPHLAQSNKFTISASKFSPAEVIVMLNDNDMPALTLELTPTQVSEGDGVTSVAAVLTRTGITNNKITIKLTDDSNGGLYYSNKTIVMDKNVETVFFNLGPVDNTLQEGDRDYTITAAIWVSSCSCSAAGQSAGSVTATLRVLDNDGAALSVASQNGTVMEGGETKLTVSRNTLTDLSAPLTVTLGSNYDADLEYPKSVTIPAGQASTEVNVRSLSNDVSGDSHTVIFTVSASGFSSGTCVLYVTDQTLPDARIARFTANVNEITVGSNIQLSAKVVNEGVAPLPEGTIVNIYKRGESKAVSTVKTDAPLAPGSEVTLTRTILLPEAVGEHTYYATVNDTKAEQELVYTNNTSQEVTVMATSPFSAEAQTDQTVYRQGAKVTITGRLIGEHTAEAEIDVYRVNDGAREVMNTKTDANGNFSVTWGLHAQQSGHFAVGACFPGDTITTEMAGFDVYGLKRADNSYITCDVTIGEPFNGIVYLKNAGTLPLTGITTEIVGAPEGCDAHFNLQPDIASGEEVRMAYTLNGSVPTEGNNWEMLRVRVTSAEGAELEVPLHYYARLAKANLVVKSQTLVTTMNKVNGRDYSFIVTNNGKGNSGKISLSLPDWMKPLTGATMPGLNQNDTATVVLRMMPTDDMQLNVPVSGKFGINCENGNGTYINFNITPVSDEKGTLVIDVCDEYTYYTDEKPHVKDAQIVVRNPVTGALVAQGTSDENGIWSMVLPEGYYQVNVTADNHDSYKNNILVDPGTTTTQVVNLSYQAVTVTWSVEETEVEDEYNIVTTVKYETNVPMPVVEMAVPDRIDAESLGEGQSLIFYAILTNKGLITAENTKFRIPETIGEYVCEPLVEIQGMQLAPQQSYTIPVKVTRMTPEASRRFKASGGDGCYMVPETDYEWKCGTDFKMHCVKTTIQVKVCPGDPKPGGTTEVGSDPPAPNGNGTDQLFEYEQHGPQVSGGSEPCIPCLGDLVMAAIDCGVSFLANSKVGCVYSLIRGLTSVKWGGGNTLWDAGGVIAGGAGCFIAGNVMATIGCIYGFLSIIGSGCGAPSGGGSGGGSGSGGGGSGGGSGSGGGTGPKQVAPMTAPMRSSYSSVALPVSSSWYSLGNNFIFVDDYYAKARMMAEYIDYFQDIFKQYFGTDEWLQTCDVTELSDLITGANNAGKNGLLDADAMRVYKPQNITNDQFNQFIERFNNSITHEQTGEEFENMINVDAIKYDTERMNYMDSIVGRMCFPCRGSDGGLGYECGVYKDVPSMYQELTRKFYQDVQEASGSVCATITLQIDQTMTMTRQAFRGTLSVGNGNKENAMTDVKLKLKVVNQQTGMVATDKEFEMHTESLKLFKGDLDMESGWYLGADSTGTATILFIPSKFAAPDEPVDYSFGGTLSYVDPNTGLEVTRELFPVTLTVKPSPELDLTYFMQRDLYGDDALTEDIEPVVPGEFAVIINNKGNGDATNVRMVTKQPQIIENEKGLFIDFEFVSSQLNGQEKALAMGESIPTEFGNIPAHTQAYAQWWLQSSLLGHFVDYDIQATHVSSYGNENLSLLDQVTIHELIHGFTPPAGSVSDGSAVGRGFLVNDIEDDDDMPDRLYFTDNSQANVAVTFDAVMTKQSNTEYILTVKPMAEGWNYGSLLDPTVGRRKLLGIVRLSDNVELPVDNMWQTDRTLLDRKEWQYENRLHFIDKFDASSLVDGVQYKLTFEDRADVVLTVESITGMELNGQPVRTTYVDEVTVTFNKAIQPETFTADDVKLNVQGETQDLSTVGFASEDNTVWTLDFTELNRTLPNGYYVLTVQTSQIKDYEGYNGYTGKKADWVLFLGGLVPVTTTEYPLYSGTILREKISGEASDSRMANYPLSTIHYPLSAPSDGNVTSAQYGDKWRFTATANEGFEFVNWTLGGVVISTNPVYETTVNGELDLVANFKKIQYKVEVTYGENGSVTGNGVYEYGTELAIVAKPNEDYALKYWNVNDEIVAPTGDTLFVTVNKPFRVMAEFVRDIYTQTVTFARGWNWMSTYLSEEQSFGTMTTYANRVLDQQNELFRDPEFGLVGGISKIEPNKGYKVDASTIFSITMRGHIQGVDAAALNLLQGWNWMAYPYFETKNVADVLTNAEDGDRIVAQEGFSEYDGSSWEGTVVSFTPGQGYLYKSATQKTLAFDFTEAPAGSRMAKSQTSNLKSQTSSVDPHLYPSTMNITARIYRDGMELPGSQYTVYAYAGDELRGVSQFVGSNHYLTVYGDEPVSISFIVESAETGETFAAAETLTFVSDVVGSRKSPYAVNISTTTGISQQMADQPMTIYTLDGILVSRDATIRTLHTLPKGVYIVNGRKTVVK